MLLPGLWLCLFLGVLAPPPPRGQPPPFLPQPPPENNDNPFDFIDSFHESFSSIFGGQGNVEPPASTTRAPSSFEAPKIMDSVPKVQQPPSVPEVPANPPSVASDNEPQPTNNVPTTSSNSNPVVPNPSSPPYQPSSNPNQPPNPGYPPQPSVLNPTNNVPPIPSYPSVPSPSAAPQYQPPPHAHSYPNPNYYGGGPYYSPHVHSGQYPYRPAGPPQAGQPPPRAPESSTTSSTPAPNKPNDANQNEFGSQEPSDTFNGYVEPSDTPYYYSGGYNPNQSYNYLSQTYGNYGKFNTVRGSGSYGYQPPYNYVPQYQPRPPQLSGLLEECSTPEGSIGQCISSSFKCTYMKGEPSGFCAKKSPWYPTRTCCVQKAECGGYPSRSRVVNIQSPNYPNTTSYLQNCPVTILVQPQVCQIRLDFLDFNMKSLENGLCEDTNSLHIQSSQASTRIPMSRLCGILSSGEEDPFRTDHPHLYIHFPDSLGAQKHILPQKEDFMRTLLLTFNVRNYTSKWNIRLTKIPCDGSVLKAPEACSQYYHER